MATRRTYTNFAKSIFREQMKHVGTSVPGNIISFDATTQLAQVQIGVQRIDVNGDTFTPPPLIKVPVVIPGGSEYFVEHQIDVGDECLIIFSQRCIDGWVNNGGIATQPIVRFHSFDDAMCIVGLRSQPNKISGHANNGVKLRNKSGDKFIWLKNDGTAEITVDTLVVNGNIEHTGDQTTSGTINADTSMTTPSVVASTNVSSPSVTAGGTEMVGHGHSYDWTDGAGSSVTGGPQ